MKIKEMRQKKNEALSELVLDLRKESFNLRFQRVQGQVTNSARFKALRRSIARAKTIKTERVLEKTAQEANKKAK
jgi:large subunit ribosomal protein L29